ncbi:MAG: MFS transporter, partial [Clostridia bacterium]|nr:MFS transporter [Clostridia bacterium]
ILTLIGMMTFAIWPYIFPSNVYLGFVIGTIIFSSSGGFAEVLISPVIAALPSKDPDREMSKLHSIYAWGVVGVIIFSTIFLLTVGNEYWQILMLILTIIPIFSTFLFLGADIPRMDTPEKVSGVLDFLKNKWLWVCFLSIFLGGATECTMAQWASGYLEQALGIQKVWGDIFGVALFAVMLGLGRTLYSKIGKNILKVLLLGVIGGSICYFVSAVTPIPFFGLFACAFTGFCASMLWPGSLIVASNRFPNGGVFIFAMMAAGGDLGASIGPQLIGLITDAALENKFLIDLSAEMGMMPEQFGMKLGMLIGMLFPLCAIPLYIYVIKNKKNH